MCALFTLMPPSEIGCTQLEWMSIEHGTRNEGKSGGKRVCVAAITWEKNPFADKADSIMSIQLLAMSGTIGSTVSTVTNYNLPFARALSLSLLLVLFLLFYLFVANKNIVRWTVSTALFASSHSATRCIGFECINISSCLYWFIVRNYCVKRSNGCDCDYIYYYYYSCVRCTGIRARARARWHKERPVTERSKYQLHSESLCQSRSQSIIIRRSTSWME